MSTDRRTFLQVLTTGVRTSAFPPSIARALSIPAYCRTGTINDVEHIVIMMQENRSFDHYYGTLRGVRGWHIWSEATFPFTARRPTPSPFATPIIVPFSDQPIPTYEMTIFIIDSYLSGGGP
jgi:phospholipase C